MNVHLVDGTYELFRAHFGAPPKKAPDGREVGATLGLLRSLLLLLSDPEVTHVAVAFDHVIESFRNQMYAGYKTGAGVDPDLLAQFPLAEKAQYLLRESRCPSWRQPLTIPDLEGAQRADDRSAVRRIHHAKRPEVRK